MKVSFIILHYKTIMATKMCIDSLFNLNDINECNIVVYDNGSNDGTLKKLKAEYVNHKNIIFVKNTQGGSFSEGNNEAYRLVKQQYGPKFMVFLNSDVQIKQHKFVTILEKEYEKFNHPYVLGPDVYNPRTKQHQSPMFQNVVTLDEIEWKITNEKKRLKRIDEIVKEYEHAKKTENLKKIIPNVVLEARDRLLKKDTSFLYKKRYLKNSVLQGSCIIVTPKYIESENCIFEPDTKFYAEELLLALKCATLGYETIYSKKLKVRHWHGMSSGFNVIPSKESLELKEKRLIHAYNIYKETLLSNPWKDRKNES